MMSTGLMSPFAAISGCFSRPHYRQSCRRAKVILEKGVRIRKPKKTHEPAIVPPLVPQVAGISRICLHSYNDYVVVSDTLEGLGVLGGGAAASGSFAGSKPADEKKRKVDVTGTGEQKHPKLRRTQTTAISQPKPAVVTGE
ncbi:hypothetical protein HanRHA438_Chr15g0714101 [Helianthus annuus]|uniref:Uncharacterized protein n=1 Tax=Helianthus annuus TaxID=4232 RepID=A0A9K3H3Z6_HELAN|nr:hypothetical protein HanXRQr2_Chr15g0701771 [Helianthus annuus]KAJ0451817.1 hypothetical protein HanHA300_Chr15g0571891 [Helianthus annuus]KAJ0456510.1 hypothetical protein HanIR_Chr15g0763261 [Helianthus annuus]KAJ0473704.1 hypothetical protein HanHA89_Chr15g0621391 [Helianthus annuus]KAJ0649281.1 hypothetical protein HanLR1_Chr15g0582491 [Helianthus annuus]